jgi:hypothetical protein
MPSDAPVSHDEYAQWRQSLFGSPYEVWHDGATFNRLIEAARSDVDSVSRMLRAGIGEHDPVAATSLNVLAAERLAPADAEDLLREAAGPAKGTVLVHIAVALYTITGDPVWGGRIASVLTGDDVWSDRIDAAMALAQFPPIPPLIHALAIGVRDDDYLVRYHSASTLLHYGGRGSVSDYPHYFQRICTPSDPASRQAVADELVALLAR